MKIVQWTLFHANDLPQYTKYLYLWVYNKLSTLNMYSTFLSFPGCTGLFTPPPKKTGWSRLTSSRSYFQNAGNNKNVTTLLVIDRCRIELPLQATKAFELSAEGTSTMFLNFWPPLALSNQKNFTWGGNVYDMKLPLSLSFDPTQGVTYNSTQSMINSDQSHYSLAGMTISTLCKVMHI